MHLITWYTILCGITTIGLSLYALEPVLTEIYVYI